MKNKSSLQVAIIFIIIALLALLMTSCNTEEIRNTQEKYSNRGNYNKTVFYESSMKYLLIRENSRGSIVVINVTKDSLECAVDSYIVFDR